MVLHKNMTLGTPNEPSEALNTIITERLITPVFQPIISLQDGTVLGFEGLSRISRPGLFDNVEEMFRYAEQTDKIWQLEQVCRRAILREVHRQQEKFYE